MEFDLGYSSGYSGLLPGDSTKPLMFLQVRLAEDAQGRHVDIYLWSCNDALELGRRAISLTVLRLGWSPQASKPSLVDRLFRQREQKRTSPVTSGG